MTWFNRPKPVKVAEAAGTDPAAGDPASAARRLWGTLCRCETCSPAGLRDTDVRASDAGAGAAPMPAPTAAVTPVGALVARHILRDGEVILLVLKPSFWYILLASLRFLGVVALGLLVAIAFEHTHHREWFYIEAAIFLAAGRIMWAVLAWMGRLYVLTDLRVIRLSGVFRVDIFDCALRKIARTAVTTSVKERLCATGSIEITPQDDTCPPLLWQTVPRPHEVHRIIKATIARAKQNGLGTGAAA